MKNLGRLDEAEDILRKAAQLQKDHSVALLSLAIVQTHAGMLPDALATLTSALESFPDNYYMHYHLGKILVQLRKVIRTTPVSAPRPSTHSGKRFAAIRLTQIPTTNWQNFTFAMLPNWQSKTWLSVCDWINHAPAQYTLARLYLSTGRRSAGQALVDRFERQQREEKQKDGQKPRIESAQN